MLKGVITSGTGAGYTDIGCPAAGKTGTTEGESDAWFVGYTPKISTAVWVGHPESRATTGFGGPTAGPIWQSYMSAAKGSYCGDFPQPQNPVPVLELLERLPHGLLPGLAGIVEQLEFLGHPRATDGHRRLDHGGRERLLAAALRARRGARTVADATGQRRRRDRRKSLGSNRRP